MQGHVYHWKHGWIPLTAYAALVKAHGSHKGAAKYLSESNGQHGTLSGKLKRISMSDISRAPHIEAAHSSGRTVTLHDTLTGHSIRLNESHAASFHSQGHVISAVHDGSFTTQHGRYGSDGRAVSERSNAPSPSSLKNPMNQMTNGTKYRETPAGIIAVRGNREIHLLGTSVNAQKQARQMLATQSFDKLFKAGKSAPGMKNVSFHRLH